MSEDQTLAIYDRAAGKKLKKVLTLKLLAELSPSVECKRVSPGDVDSDEAGLDRLEDCYRLPV